MFPLVKEQDFVEGVCFSNLRASFLNVSRCPSVTLTLLRNRSPSKLLESVELSQSYAIEPNQAHFGFDT
jgi:hypothetical protein